MTTPPLDKLNCDVPGAQGNQFEYYGHNPSEHIRIWRPDDWATTGFKNKPVIVWIHGGAGHNPGNSMNPATGGYVDTLHTVHGWPVISIEYPPTAKNEDPKEDFGSCLLHPGYLLSAARALSYLKTNYGPGTDKGEEFWGLDGAGDVNSIDPAQVVVAGFSHGATMALLLGLIPSARFPRDTDLPLGKSRLHYGASHVPRAIVADSAQMDWTQFALNPTTTVGTYRDDRLQIFNWFEDAVLFGRQYGGTPGTETTPNNKVPEHWKRDASPYWWALRGYPEARGVSFLLSGPKAVNSDPDQLNLTPAHWSPGVNHIEEDLGLAWYDPHHNFQTQPMGDLLTSLELQNWALWGNATTNPNGLNKDALVEDDFIVDTLIGTLGLA